MPRRSRPSCTGSWEYRGYQRKSLSLGACLRAIQGMVGTLIALGLLSHPHTCSWRRAPCSSVPAWSSPRWLWDAFWIHLGCLAWNLASFRPWLARRHWLSQGIGWRWESYREASCTCIGLPSSGTLREALQLGVSQPSSVLPSDWTWAASILTSCCQCLARGFLLHITLILTFKSSFTIWYPLEVGVAIRITSCRQSIVVVSKAKNRISNNRRII